MVNRLKVAKVLSIQELFKRGFSERRIARELGVSRGAVARHLAELKSNEAKAPIGREVVADSNEAKAPIGTGTASAQPPPMCRSQCEPFRDVILSKLEIGLTAQRIYQDLVDEHGFSAKYHSVRRYVARLRQVSPVPFRRMECEPGEEVQIDFGKGAPIVDGNRRRRTHVLRVVLSHSRRGYSEVVYRQTTDDLIRCLENAFHHFGGVPKTIVPDNLKAAVIKADWHDPDLNPKLESFCEHYGTVLLPTKPRTPRHKGKVERGVGYVQENALKGKEFSSLQEQNAYLLEWERAVADMRLHGTTRKQVLNVFETVEKTALLPLPSTPFPNFDEGQRKVSRDGHIAVAKSYYSVPPEYLGHTLWIRWDARIVRVFDKQMEPICIHARQLEGQFSTLPEHIASEKISAVERGADWLLERIEFIGSNAHAWAQGCVAARGIQAVRVMQGLVSLTSKHRCEEIEKACSIAHANQCYRLKSVRELIGRSAAKQQEFGFIEKHPLIRNLSEYGDLVRTDFQKEAWNE